MGSALVKEHTMHVLTSDSYPQIGMAYSNYTPRFLREHPNVIDYVEVPFELLCFDSSVLQISTFTSIVLHCASMSIAGSVLPTKQTVTAVQDWIHRTRTPWLGEHLSFIVAEREQAGPFLDEYA